MIIRKMTIEDYDEVYSLWMSCVGMGLNNLDDIKKRRRSGLRFLMCAIGIGDRSYVSIINYSLY